MADFSSGQKEKNTLAEIKVHSWFFFSFFVTKKAFSCCFDVTDVAFVAE